jgi:hypothetical protein
MRMRDPQHVGADLKIWMAGKRLSEAELALKISNENKGIAITQSWLSRIINGKFRRLTPKVRRVADYADIPVFEKGDPDPDSVGSKIIGRAVDRAWDGSVSHANLIARLIKVAEELRLSDHANVRMSRRKRGR